MADLTYRAERCCARFLKYAHSSCFQFWFVGYLPGSRRRKIQVRSTGMNRSCRSLFTSRTSRKYSQNSVHKLLVHTILRSKKVLYLVAKPSTRMELER